MTDALTERAPAPARRFAPRIAVVIPVYKHSALLAEAIESVLAQTAPFEIATIVVDDGCPFPETAEVARAYAMAHANVSYLRKPNGGLSSARNAGIDYALRHFPGFEAIYLLDADNRVTPNALEVLLAFLQSRPDIDWVYPNIDKFGISWSGNYTTEYSRLLHLTFDNICEAGSLVSRRMIDAGVRFDETMRSGFEDWDFWLQAMGRGFKGANHPHFGFEYRQRAESMLRDSNRTRESILSYIRQKHKALFQPDTLIACEHAEAPRYASIGIGTYVVRAFTDPDVAHESYELGEFVRRFWAARNEPDTYGAPPFLLWMTDAQRRALSRMKLLHNVLWLGERLSERFNFVAIRFRSAPSRMEMEVRPVSATEPLEAKLSGWMTTHRILSACVDDKSDDWVRTLRQPHPGPSVVELVITAPFTPREMQGAVLSPTNALLATLGALRDSGFRAARGQKWIWRESYLPDRSRYHELLRRALGTEAVMPRLPAPERPLRVGMLLPIASFGGVEKVAFALSRVLKAAGCEVHLFILGKPVYELHRENEGLFTSVNFLASDYPIWGGAHVYSGHELLMEGDEAAIAPTLMGLLTGLDVIVNNQVASVNSVLGSLRRSGVKVLNYLHVLDRTQHGRDAGHPYLALAFEHVYDALLTCSEDMVDWLHAMGVPRAKLLHVPNAPSYELAEADRLAVLADRPTRPAGPLRALFIGRFDAQKGVERLHGCAGELVRRGVPVDWRVVGRDVLDEGAGQSWQARFAEIGIATIPPLYDPRDLTRAFGWADVVVMPSRWEGAPLTILEAQRVGCVPLSTAVGAVEELVSDGQDGLLVRAEGEGAVALAFADALARLAGDRAELARLRDGAAARAAETRWERSTEGVLKLLDGWFPKRLANLPKGAPRLIQVRAKPPVAAKPARLAPPRPAPLVAPPVV
ncbi:glycosyltransferase [Aureimonas sp. AU40]|uniref:glycosyltransferase n=1 Tax=Aureimonas sp. AU40 TaxID=1637747 RepID=UPI000782BA78|nr:glycosyltransferase [Aureimonas sp. AU40]